MANPLIFGIKKFNEENKNAYECTCLDSEDYQKSFSFDEEGFSSLDIYS